MKKNVAKFLSILFYKRLFFDAPQNNFKNHMLNKFGFQKLRYFLLNKKFKLKKINQNSKNFKFKDLLNKDGILMIKNFFKENEYERLKQNINQIKSYCKIDHYFLGNKDTYSFVFNKKSNNETNSLINEIKQLFGNSIIKELLMSCSNININDIFTDIIYQKILSNDSSNDFNDHASEFHSDKCYPCFKGFLTLNHNTVSSGCYEYIKGSHLPSPSRLEYEYYLSLFESKIYNEKTMYEKGFQFRNNRITITDRYIDKNFGMNSIKKCEAEENSLIISNNMGFHKRGRFENNQIREQLRFGFYKYQKSDFSKWLRYILNRKQ